MLGIGPKAEVDEHALLGFYPSLGREPVNGLYSDQRKDVRSHAKSGLRRVPYHVAEVPKAAIPTSSSVNRSGPRQLAVRQLTFSMSGNRQLLSKIAFCGP